MNKKSIKILMLLAYCIPYGYLSMEGDFSSGTMLFYGLMIICLGALVTISIKTKNTIVVIIGNILSFISSYIFISQNQTEDWASYFKPFVPFDLLILITVITFVIQLLFIFRSRRKNKI